jgi:hypothetical protein
MAVLDQTLQGALTFFGQTASKALGADVFSFVGGINPEYLIPFRSEIERLASHPEKSEALAFFINTPGGIAETAEQMVSIIRHHYTEVWFVVPDSAMSAGTILCMSGDKIYMDYSSALGPIDPQVQSNEGKFVPAMGYLDQVDRFIEKSRNGTLTDAEFALLQNQDIAKLRRFEQARELSISLLKDWLVKYKFKDWKKHQSTGKKVTELQKTNRAKEIAEKLSDHKLWHSHGRMIGIKTLTDMLKLRIDDYTDTTLSIPIRNYSDIILDLSRNRPVFFHSVSLSEANQNVAQLQS